MRLFLLGGLCLLTAVRGMAAVPATAQNFVLQLKVSAVTVQRAYGTSTAPEGKQFAILATEWTNAINPKLAADRGLATEYSIGELGANLFLVANGRDLGELRGGLPGPGGRVSLSSVNLDKPGARIAGDVVFELPVGPASSLELRYYDDTGGHLQLSLAGTPPAATSVSPLQKNPVFELGVFSFNNPVTAPTAPAVFRAIAVELRGRSVWQSEGPPPGYDPAHAPDTTISRVNLLNWGDTRKYIHVLADGVYAYPPDESSTLPDAARFIPEFLTGGRLVFFVPADAKSLELFCAMPHAAAPTGGTMDLAPMTFALAGPPPPPDSRKPALAIKDEMFSIGITSARRLPTFAGANAEEGQQFLVLAVTVSNQGETGEFFQPRDQLLLANAKGEETGLDEVTTRGPHRPEDQIHLPAGAQRSFEVVYRIPRTGPEPKLSFHGGSFMQAYALPR